jgi:TPR repeat protein
MSLNFKVFVLPFAVVVLSCITSCTSTTKVISTNQSDELSDEQVVYYIKQAEDGNNQAAFRLYLYYSCIKLDRESAITWLALAATNGNVAAQYDMGMMYDGGIYPDLTDIKKAKYWFEKASCNGNTNATI